MARFEGSGRSRREFAAEASVGLAIFQYWLYKLRREQQAMAVRKARVTEVRLVPVTVRGLSGGRPSEHATRARWVVGYRSGPMEAGPVRRSSLCLSRAAVRSLQDPFLRKLITDKAEAAPIEAATVVPVA